MARDMVTKIVSGGQIGVDRAALDVALALSLPCGGWCPKGRRAEDGRIVDRYPLKETPSPHYAMRTRWNVRDSDGTLILTQGPLTGGTAVTLTAARRSRKPVLVIDLSVDTRPVLVHDWLQQHGIAVLNVAGPRESTVPGIYARAHSFLMTVLCP